jgi:BT1 family
MQWLGVTDKNFDHLWLLVLITNLSTLLPLPLLGWLPSEAEAPPEGNPPVTAIDLDSTATKHLSQPILPDLVAELVASPPAIAKPD